jgi:hypothetical protein
VPDVGKQPVIYASTHQSEISDRAQNASQLQTLVVDLTDLLHGHVSLLMTDVAAEGSRYSGGEAAEEQVRPAAIPGWHLAALTVTPCCYRLMLPHHRRYLPVTNVLPFQYPQHVA